MSSWMDDVPIPQLPDHCDRWLVIGMTDSLNDDDEDTAEADAARKLQLPANAVATTSKLSRRIYDTLLIYTRGSLYECGGCSHDGVGQPRL